MKRHPALQDLSRDHYAANIRALHVLRATEGHPRAPPLQQALYNFEGLWTDEGLPQHFLEEEAHLVPLLRDGNPEAAERLLREHAELRAGFESIVAKKASAREAAATAANLMAHARWEEEVVYMWTQENLGERELQGLAGESQAFRAARGRPVGPPNAPR